MPAARFRVRFISWLEVHELKDLTATMDHEDSMRLHDSVKHIEEHVHVVERMLKELHATE